MLTSIAADLLVTLHLLFIIFVLLGGLLVARWHWIALLHIPAAIWGALIEYQGWICPLTPMEQQLRKAAGEAGYEGGFVEHYILPIIYPDFLSREIQIGMGTVVIIFNLLVYAWVIYRLKERKKPRS
ncbi:MAG: DUF2784 domain-containing protein [Gammaproteobacteria bacterium]|nr:DUF2784 domain-containing protein [Gammaproteobacteria bacterium]